MTPFSTSTMSRIYLTLWMLLSIVRNATSERSCGVSFSPCPSGCWNPTSQVQADGLRICEIVSPGFYSPDSDDAQYACETNPSACNPCPKQGFLRGITGCSSEQDKEQMNNNFTMAPATEEEEVPKDGEEKLNNKQMSKFLYALIFSLLMIGCIYIRARIVDCRTRQKNRRTRPIPPPPTDPKPKAAQIAVLTDSEELSRPAVVESSVEKDVEQG
ncbi:hypothetical protein FisN_6Hh189 [Fistulifera solaris]|uniref:TNFR-Cys domain-containing protein n=1 Tax=Fistulifera solaris TaxID=1519565 RepID=A0A1Z5KFI9_FISSO|nr:hypothetical protein FisN_6Hh189 [Fistulifera solaris]|eukprot:GAX24862.1 hypothetical protein FisN_6Hh189 [Fistulifera solaris]